MMTGADKERARMLAFDAYRFVFNQIDNEPHISGDEAGWIATQVEAAFLEAYASVVMPGEPNPFARQPQETQETQ
jgi:hypothetical protein